MERVYCVVVLRDGDVLKTHTSKNRDELELRLTQFKINTQDLFHYGKTSSSVGFVDYKFLYNYWFV